uniref:Uncharacterized protein n=1 Tax=Physcomitrium patens TaxID=3218 RepID=A0A7I3Z6D2_PHYPA
MYTLTLGFSHLVKFNMRRLFFFIDCLLSPRCEYSTVPHAIFYQAIGATNSWISGLHFPSVGIICCCNRPIWIRKISSIPLQTTFHRVHSCLDSDYHPSADPA